MRRRAAQRRSLTRAASAPQPTWQYYVALACALCSVLLYVAVDVSILLTEDDGRQRHTSVQVAEPSFSEATFLVRKEH